MDAVPKKLSSQSPPLGIHRTLSERIGAARLKPPDGAVTPRKSSHAASGMVARPCNERSVLLGSFPVNRMAVPVMMSSGPQ